MYSISLQPSRVAEIKGPESLTSYQTAWRHLNAAADRIEVLNTVETGADVLTGVDMAAYCRVHRRLADVWKWEMPLA